MEDVDSSEDRLFATFDKYQEFLDTQRMLLSYDILEEPGAEADREESILLNKLIGTVSTLMPHERVHLKRVASSTNTKNKHISWIRFWNRLSHQSLRL